ncbi:MULTISPECIES: exodeoxyribonuclease VII small subunit [Rothia]|uniref:Exodeoxyribonuclease 7 small subunit n=1 Tax=Rothia nasimurium TaxID=85336 RepID=A0A1Y1RT99_9MICC|nr:MULTISPECIES: exodeoxyribonuclease VII small subunit [Rothia]ORC24486.1 exodeoxyribonuclease VII small subunit [Rothia nasimurium]
MSDNIEFTAELNATPVDQLTYEQAREELLQVVARMESGASTLEESIALWERGEALATRCEAWLDGAAAKLDAARTAQGQSA